MKGGSDLQKYVDLLIPGPSKIKIIHGEGPVHLVGSHCVEFFGFKEDEDSDDDEEETAKGNKSGDKKTTPEKAEKKSTPSKEEKKVTPNKDEKKRKNSSDPKSAEKKAKN